MSKQFKWRWTFFLTGLLVMSLGVTLTIKGRVIGTGPWDVLHIGLFKQFGLSIGTWTILTGLFIILATSIYLREWPRVGTWLNMALVGTFIDMFNWLLPETDVFAWALLYFFAGFVVHGVGCGLYISAALGAGPRDSVMMIIVERFGGSVRMARTIMEVFAAAAGWMLGGPVGFGTVILALGTGYIIQPSLHYFRRRLQDIIDV
ncbi:MAG: YitT family protein [Lysinibacillus sp.]